MHTLAIKCNSNQNVIDLTNTPDDIENEIDLTNILDEKDDDTIESDNKNEDDADEEIFSIYSIDDNEVHDNNSFISHDSSSTWGTKNDKDYLPSDNSDESDNETENKSSPKCNTFSQFIFIENNNQLATYINKNHPHY